MSKASKQSNSNGEAVKTSLVDMDPVSDKTDNQFNDIATKDHSTEKNESHKRKRDSSSSNMVDPLAPEDVHPLIAQMLQATKINMDTVMEKVNALDDRVLVLEDISDHIGADVAKFNDTPDSVALCNKTLMDRLVRAETRIEQQQIEITNLTSRSMRDNIIIRTTGEEYKEILHEDTCPVVKRFIAKEMRVADANLITITRAHCMG